jgi:prophage tail gpP-like protein
VLQVLVDNRNGNVWDLPVSSINYRTVRIGKASSVDFTFLSGGIYESTNFQINNGDIVRVTLDAIPVFYGYVFKIDGGRDEAVKITAYDQTRYLMGSDTYVFKNTTATNVLKKLANDSGLKVSSELADTSYAIPKIVADGEKLFDIIVNALADTTRSTGKSYVFFDNLGELTIKQIEDLAIDLSLGDQSLVYDYSTSRSIDSDTYNRIKLVQDIKNKKGKVTGRDVYIAQDSNNIDKWGRLQYYQKLDDGLNTAQINEVLTALSQLKNRETRTFSISALGDIRVRAGCKLSVNIEEAGVYEYYLVDECEHKFDGEEHTMSLSLKVYG